MRRYRGWGGWEWGDGVGRYRGWGGWEWGDGVGRYRGCNALIVTKELYASIGVKGTFLKCCMVPKYTEIVNIKL